jgi:uncharacterized repeat protein (TIGR01451 family)
MRLLLWLLAMVAVLSPAAPALAATCAPATSQGTAPPTWQTYCWIDFTDLNLTTARTTAGQNFSITLSDGATLTFNLRISGTPNIVSRAAPSWTGAAVGNTAFLGIPNRPILYQQAGGTNTVTISSILITPPPGVPAVTAYSFVAADAESTNNGESLRFQTNGTGWTILDAVDPISGTLFPSYTGVGTSTFTETGVAGTVGGYIVGTNSPTTVTTTLVGGGLQGAMFAVRFASIRLNKVISGGRVNAADQFKFDINATGSGSTLATGTSTGTGNGPFSAAAVSLASGIPLTLTEAMASGSVSTLAKYQSRLTCTNGTTGSSTVLPTNLATTSYSFGSLQFGDAIACTFTNTAFPHLTLRKALPASGRVFATDQFKMDINTTTTSVATTTTTGTGATVTNAATPQTQVTAGQTYSMTESAAGTTNLTYYTATVACTNVATSSTTVLPTTLPAIVTPQMGDVISCTVTNTQNPANANLVVTKSSVVTSDPVNGGTSPKAIPGSFVTYTITVTNTGTLPVDASTIFIRDPLPSQVSYNGATTVGFAQGAITSGLTFSLASDVRFSKSATTPANFAACTDTPAAGVDPTIRFVCIRPTGTMNGATAAGQPSFSVTFQTQVK